jgi:polysaccharide pyruvyl transferase CsaB
MKRIAVAGYYGYGNIGDEAILEALAQRLASYPEIRISVLSSNPLYTFNTQGLSAVSRRNPFAVIKAIVNSDYLVSGGGGLIQDSTSLRSPYFYLFQILLTIFLARRFVILGQGIGPLRGAFARFLTRELFKEAQAITVRDLNSKTFLMESLPPDFDLTVTADIALMLQSASKERAEDILYDEGAADLPTPILGVSIKGNRKDKKTAGFYASAISSFIEETQGGALFIPFFPKYDTEFAKKVMTGVKGPAAILRKRYKPSEILSIFGSMDHILAGRYHGTIFASLAEKSFTPIAYDPKIEYFLDELGIENNIVTPVIGARSIEEALLNDYENAVVRIEKVQKRLRPIIQRAEQNISKLLQVLEIEPS